MHDGHFDNKGYLYDTCKEKVSKSRVWSYERENGRKYPQEDILQNSPKRSSIKVLIDLYVKVRQLR
jgi:hypothetical protein